MIIDAIHRDQLVPQEYVSRLAYLIEQGVVEKVRGKDFVLSGTFHKFMGRRGTYTRKIGLDREENKALVLKHIEMNKADGSPLREIQQVLPSKSKVQVQWLLKSLENKHLAHFTGWATNALWYPGPKPEDVQEDEPSQQISLLINDKR